MDEPLYAHHVCDACQFLGQRDGHDLYHCTQPGHPKPFPILVAVVENAGGERREKLAWTAREAQSTPVLADALRLANERGLFLDDQPTRG
jgi:hypothetical protein